MFSFKPFFRRAVVAATAGIGTFAVLAGSGQACSPNTYVGSICIVAGAWCPKGFFEVEGQLLEVAEYKMLYAYVSEVYGGDYRRFELPDLRGRTPVAYGHGKDLMPIYIGQHRGLEARTMATVHLPPHSHTVSVKASDGRTKAIPKGWLANPLGHAGLSAVHSDAFIPDDDTASGATLNSGSIGETGSGQKPILNIPPQVGVRYCIATSGSFPAQPK